MLEYPLLNTQDMDLMLGHLKSGGKNAGIFYK
jgi:hypothetical protein